ncbi:bifunctional hydroxymethylpyrimidine kinase/phosphomethylpyrimidine kinase [Candidatus Oleimmundimicrobium sp.]|uniref:bifunctional hydroxymethylpyrimidine kinase/phosphomethylpyrimidine kinase n=1 Tax=Candidatus Oleimmundimicrobium sp. TaxID=3060597 RepID=UPI00271BCD02|nr:bifunctional hydroxymethylpyrimidine kinase/phosphomethylpyrimidine kinase [Candidatus Oleimmundimicrobium sp.]MDO8885337.1 bifunctional hydroxymethylpyrimidine kinase/phosphomethylpyrimidine kinase [Candidatus Oleimmundimicrobium sp.]
MKGKKILVIGGSDPSGGAGIQVDRLTCADLGVYPYSILTAVIAQNSSKVLSIERLSSDIISKQLEAVFLDTRIDTVKIGALTSIEAVEVVSSFFEELKVKNIVIDPVIQSSSGTSFLSPSAVSLMKIRLFRIARVVTPNIPEAERLTGFSIKNFDDMKKAAEAIKTLGPEWVLIKGGHLQGDECTDFLFNGNIERKYSSKRINKNVKGTGCIFSSALASQLALNKDVPEAVELAKLYVTERISKAISLGKGNFQSIPSFFENFEVNW